MSPARIPPGPPVILCADDYGISGAVSAAIEELAEAGRLSATSCMVTFPEWPVLARRLASLRGRIAIGLHLNLTVGAPLGEMPAFAPGGAFPVMSSVIGLALRGSIDAAEIERETARQLKAFTEAAGFAPDFLDGHQHVHALPRVRNGVLAALAGLPLLVRDPSDDLARIIRRKMFAKKAMSVSTLAFGFAKSVRAGGFVVNVFLRLLGLRSGLAICTGTRGRLHRLRHPPPRHVPSRSCGRRARHPRQRDGAARGGVHGAYGGRGVDGATLAAGSQPRDYLECG